MLTGPEKFRPGIPGFAEFADEDRIRLMGTLLQLESYKAEEKTDQC